MWSWDTACSVLNLRLAKMFPIRKRGSGGGGDPVSDPMGKPYPKRERFVILFVKVHYLCTSWKA